MRFAHYIRGRVLGLTLLALVSGSSLAYGTVINPSPPNPASISATHRIEATPEILAIGSTLPSLTTGKRDVFYGFGDGTSVTTATGAVGVGDEACESLTTGESAGPGNVCIGTEAGRSLTIGGRDTVGGFKAGSSAVSAESLTAWGYEACAACTENRNSAFGAQAGLKLKAGTANNFFGYQTADDLETGSYNALFGTFADGNSISGSKNTVMGWGALGEPLGFRVETATNEGDTVIGYAAGFEAPGNSNVLIGKEAGRNTQLSNRLYISNSSTEEPLIYGNFAAKELKVFGTLSATTITYPAGSIEAAAIAAATITAEKLAGESVTEGKLAKEAVTASKLKANAVESAAIKGEAVTEGKLANEAITAAKVKKEALGAEQLATNAVESGKIKAEAVLAGKIANEAVEATKLKNGAVTLEKIGAEAVAEGKLAKAVQEKLFKVGAWGARTERTKGTAVEPSATEPVQVALEVNCKTLTETTIEVKVGATVLPKATCGSGTATVTPRVNMSFIVPAAKTFEVVTATNIETVFSSYLPL
jgi:hypothetical protein